MRPQTIVERLDFISKRIPGLKFTPPTQLKPGDDQGFGCFMSCDMFYIEIKVDQSHQSVKDVIIRHNNNDNNDIGISCPVLRKVLGDQNFETFAKHLAGLHSIYQISTNDKKVKQKAYPALTALETDLTILYDHQRRRTNNCHELVHKSPIGIMEPRRGGLPVRLTYFVTPYDLIDTASRSLLGMTINNIIDRNIGLSATVEIEGSKPHKLQIESLISTPNNSSLPAYAPFNTQNSEKLPAQFVLKLSQPFPMLNTSLNQIINELNNEPATIKEFLINLTANSKQSLVSLIARQELDLNKGPFCRSVDLTKAADSDLCDIRKHVYTIKLLDQYHTYHILDHYLECHEGVYVTKIPFTHPTSIPNIIRVLRQQAVFNFVIGSCIRRNNNSIMNIKGNISSLDDQLVKMSQESDIFDVIPVSLNNICISFEHPSKESLATLEIDFKEPSCQLYALPKESVCSNEYATKVFQKCWSIPVLLRSVMKKCDERRLALLEDANKRRELELQELLTNNAAQQSLQYKPNVQFQDAMLQSKFNSINDKSSSRDLNSIAEFLSSKVNSTNTNTIDASNQTANNVSEASSSKSNLMKKFSCKPKAKQNTTTKNQSGTKILSLMLKRQNSTTSSTDDATLKATLIKKAKTKSSQGEGSGTKTGSGNITTTKLISTEAAAAARLANKQNKHGINHHNLSLSLIRSPNKSQNSIQNAPFALSAGGGLMQSTQSSTSGIKLIEPTILHNSNSTMRFKSQPNGSNSNLVKPRKSSIGAVIDNLVGGLNPSDQNSSSGLSASSDSNESTGKGNGDQPKGSSLSSAKSKSKQQADQFAIKQGSLGSLKLTVTKTKLASATSSSSTSSSTSNTLASNSSTTATTSTSSSSSSSSLNSINTPNNSTTVGSNQKSDNSKILNLGSSTSSIKYQFQIPKISKTQQASQSASSNPTTNEGQNQVAESNPQGDDTINSSSSTNSQPAASSTTNKRNTPFNRTNNSSRNPVSSSTHPLGRTTSNPLANTNSRPSSTSTNDNYSMNRISSTNQVQRQQQGQRMINLQQQPPPLQQQVPQQQQQPIQRGLLHTVATPQQLQLNQGPMFAIGLGQQQPQQASSIPVQADLNLLAANQAALLDHQRNQQQNSGPSLQQHLPLPFMSSSVDANLISSSRPQLAPTMPALSASAVMNSTSCDSLHRPSPSVINTPPQFYMRQPMFDDSNNNAVSSSPRIINEPSQSLVADRPRTILADTNSLNPTAVYSGTAKRLDQIGAINPLGGGPAAQLCNETLLSAVPGGIVKHVTGGVSSSSDMAAVSQESGPTISTPSSPTECSQVETIEPPPMIPIDSLEEPQATSSENDNHPDDASDRLSIVDANDNIADSNANSPLAASGQDSNSAIPSSSSPKLSQAQPSSQLPALAVAPSSSSQLSGATPDPDPGLTPNPTPTSASATATATTATTLASASSSSSNTSSISHLQLPATSSQLNHPEQVQQQEQQQ